MFIIANTSRRHWEVRHYIRSTNKGVLVVIPSGAQEEVKNLTPGEQDELIAHLRRFGAIERSEVHRKQKNFEGLVDHRRAHGRAHRRGGVHASDDHRGRQRFRASDRACAQHGEPLGHE